MTHPLITQDHIDTFQKDGVVMIKGLFADEVVTLREGVARNMSDPGPYAAENLHKGRQVAFLMTIVTGPAFPSLKMLFATLLLLKLVRI